MIEGSGCGTIGATGLGSVGCAGASVGVRYAGNENDGSGIAFNKEARAFAATGTSIWITQTNTRIVIIPPRNFIMACIMLLMLLLCGNVVK
jgi:hypothetical protein